MAAMNAAALRTCQAEFGKAFLYVLKYRQHGQEHHDGQVLDDEHPDHHPGRQSA
jgi:hypothetical protein